jgi:import inner membrane translocase subunit TIM8
LTTICWKKCVTSSVRSGALEKGEQTCLANCVDRFMDANLLTMKHLRDMRQQ